MGDLTGVKDMPSERSREAGPPRAASEDLLDACNGTAHPPFQEMVRRPQEQKGPSRCKKHGCLKIERGMAMLALPNTSNTHSAWEFLLRCSSSEHGCPGPPQHSGEGSMSVLGCETLQESSAVSEKVSPPATYS